MMIVENNSIFMHYTQQALAASFWINQNDHSNYHTFCIGMFSIAVSLIYNFHFIMIMHQWKPW